MVAATFFVSTGSIETYIFRIVALINYVVILLFGYDNFSHKMLRDQINVQHLDGIQLLEITYNIVFLIVSKYFAVAFLVGIKQFDAVH